MLYRKYKIKAKIWWWRLPPHSKSFVTILGLGVGMLVVDALMKLCLGLYW